MKRVSGKAEEKEISIYYGGRQDNPSTTLPGQLLQSSLASNTTQRTSTPWRLETHSLSLTMSTRLELPWATELLAQFGIALSADTARQETTRTTPYSCEQCGSSGSNRTSYYDPNQYCNYCNGCNEIYCNSCWAAQGPHRRGTLTITGVPHEKTDPNVAELVRATLQSNPSKDEQQRLYQDDENTTWFGLVEVDGEPTFRDYGRYVDLMGISTRQPSQCQYPSLISFVGPAGK